MIERYTLVSATSTRIRSALEGGCLLRPWALATFVIATFVAIAFTLVNEIFISRNTFIILEWYINYDSGFIRRGLPGTLLSWVQDALSVSIMWPVFLLTLILYAVSLFTVYQLVARVRPFFPVSLLIYSPWFLLFPVSSWQAAARKEILFITFLSLFCLVILRSYAGRSTSLHFLVLTASFPALVLSHEMIVFYTPYAAIAILLSCNPHRKQLALLLIVASMIAMFFVTNAPGTVYHAEALCSSLSSRLGFPYDVDNCATGNNPIAWLARDAEDAVKLVSTRLPVLLYTAPPALLLTAVAFAPMQRLFREFDSGHKRMLLFGFIISLISTTPLFIVAVDWGRFIYVHAVSMGLLTLATIARLPAKRQEAALEGVKPVPWFLILGYLFFWNLRHLDVLVGGGLIIGYLTRLLFDPKQIGILL